MRYRATGTSTQVECRASVLILPRPRKMLRYQATGTSTQVECRASVLVLPRPRKMLRCEAPSTVLMSQLVSPNEQHQATYEGGLP